MHSPPKTDPTTHAVEIAGVISPNIIICLEPLSFSALSLSVLSSLSRERTLQASSCSDDGQGVTLPLAIMNAEAEKGKGLIGSYLPRLNHAGELSESDAAVEPECRQALTAPRTPERERISSGVSHSQRASSAASLRSARASKVQMKQPFTLHTIHMQDWCVFPFLWIHFNIFQSFSLYFSLSNNMNIFEI